MFRKLTVLVLCFSLFVLSGCASDNKPSNQQNSAAQQNNQQAKDSKSELVMKDFNELIKKNNVQAVAQFISDNVSAVTPEAASKMIIQFERLQRNNLSKFEAMFSQGDMPNKLFNEHQAVMSNGQIKDQQVKELLDKTRASGYKVETAEGFYFPIIDYQFYKKFSSQATPDIKAYIDIMSEESSKVPAKDAALVISWNEVIARALNQEKFLKNYQQSEKSKDIKELYKNYMTFTLYGLNNTPLFSYETNTLDPKVKEVYLNAVKNVGDSNYLKILSNYLEIIKKSNYKLTDEVKTYRDNVSQKLN